MSYHDLALNMAFDRFGRDGVSRVDVNEAEAISGTSELDVVVILDDRAVAFDPDEAIVFKRDLRAAFDAEGAPHAVVSFRSRFDEVA